MNPLPAELRAALPVSGLTIADTWWSTLDDDQRSQIAQLWDERLEVEFFSPQTDANGCLDGWEQVPEVEGGRFIPHDDSRRQNDWAPSYFEHLLQHPELVLAYEPERRTFLIGCTIHSLARECLSAGSVPVNYDCPFSLKSCPLENLRGSRLRKRMTENKASIR